MTHDARQEMAHQSSPQFRPYRSSDRDAVSEIFTRVNRELAPAHMRDAFEEYIELSIREEIGRIPDYYDPRRGASFWVLANNGDIWGYFGLEPAGGNAMELRRMHIDAIHRRRGFGMLMLRHAEQVARSQGASKLVLSTSELQQTAIALYRSARYALVSEDIATSATNKTVGHGVRRFHFEKSLAATSASDR
jgi:putative acetyltransferase